RAADAELVLELFHLPRACLPLEDEGCDPAMIVARVRLREDDERHRDAAMSDELLGSVEHILVAVLLRPRRHRARVGPAARLRECVGSHLLARCERWAEPLLLLLSPRDEDRVGAQRLHREDQRRACARFGDLLDAHADRDAGAGDPAVFLGERNAEDAALRKQLLDVLRILGGLVDLGGARRDPILHELADRVPDRDLLGGEFEVHTVSDYPAFYPLSSSRAITIRWTWFEPS